MNLATRNLAAEQRDASHVIKPFVENIVALAHPRKFVIETSPFSITYGTAQTWNIHNQRGLQELELLCPNIEMTDQLLREVSSRLVDVRALAFCVPVQPELLDDFLRDMPARIKSLTLKSRTNNKKEKRLTPQGMIDNC